MPNGDDTDLPAEVLEIVLDACDALEARLCAVEAEMLSRMDNGDGPTPVAGGGSAALLEQTLEEGM
jgi:hypothetical protein